MPQKLNVLPKPLSSSELSKNFFSLLFWQNLFDKIFTQLFSFSFWRLYVIATHMIVFSLFKFTLKSVNFSIRQSIVIYFYSKAIKYFISSWLKSIINILKNERTMAMTSLIFKNQPSRLGKNLMKKIFMNTIDE